MTKLNAVRKARTVTEPIPAASIALTFYLDDFSRTLFPLKTNRELIERGEPKIKEYIAKCLDEKDAAYSFSVQHRVYAAKQGLHLRRTVKLDPVAEYYLYDVIFRNRSLFRKPHCRGRTHYGYRFEGGGAISPSAAYKGFKGAISEFGSKYSHSMSFDVASYFNGVYHHDLVSWFCELGAIDEDTAGLGQLLRELNSGRSVDCLPQGLYPAKMIGNDFLRFIDNHHGLKSNELVRFMDDIYLFANSEQAIIDDFQLIQKLLGEKGLSVNPQKTRWNVAVHSAMEGEIDSVKRKLLGRRRLMVTQGYDACGEEIIKEIMIKSPLSLGELKYIDNILAKPELDEEDAELVLTIMVDHADRVEKRLPYIIQKYPHLTKSVYTFCGRMSDVEMVASAIFDQLAMCDQIMEFQLFWFAAILGDYLMDTSKASALISRIFEHRSATAITKAKVLEIPDKRFGLCELRDDYLRGESDWLAWSSAVGSRCLKPTSRNHRLKYFGKSSQINHLIATIMLQA